MARSRILKPEFARNYALYQAEKESGLPCRVAFAMLWSVTDRRGVFKWTANIKPDVLPYDDGVDMLAVLEVLRTAGFVLKYEVAGRTYGYIASFKDHQNFHRAEQASKDPLPPEVERGEAWSEHDASTVQASCKPAARPAASVSVSVSTSTSTTTTAADAAAELVEDAVMRKKARIETKTEEQPAFVAAWERYPMRAGGNSRKLAHRAFAARVAEGVPLADLIAAVDRYAAFVRATGREGTEYVKQAATFFGPGEHWREGWDVPRLPADRSPGAANGESAAMALMRRQDLQRAEWQAELATWTAAETARRLAPGPHEEVRPC